MRRDSGNVHGPGGDVNEEQNVVRDEALEGAHLNSQEIRRCHALPVRL